MADKSRKLYLVYSLPAEISDDGIYVILRNNGGPIAVQALSKVPFSRRGENGLEFRCRDDWCWLLTQENDLGAFITGLLNANKAELSVDGLLNGAMQKYDDASADECAKAFPAPESVNHEGLSPKPAKSLVPDTVAKGYK